MSGVRERKNSNRGRERKGGWRKVKGEKRAIATSVAEGLVSIRQAKRSTPVVASYAGVTRPAEHSSRRSSGRKGSVGPRATRTTAGRKKREAIPNRPRNRGSNAGGGDILGGGGGT